MDCQLPIADCQLFRRRRRFARRGEDGGDLSRFWLQVGQSLGRHHFRLGDHLQPELHFVRFFFGDPDLGDELGFRSILARGAVIRRDRSARARNLIREDAAFHSPRQLLREVQHSQRKGLRPRLQILRSHA